MHADVAVIVFINFKLFVTGCDDGKMESVMLFNM